MKCRISHSVIWHHLQAHVKTFLSCFDANCFSASFVFLSLWTSLCAKSQNTKNTIPFLMETIQYKSFQLHFIFESRTKGYILSTAQVKYQHVNATSFCGIRINRLYNKRLRFLNLLQDKFQCRIKVLNETKNKQQKHHSKFACKTLEVYKLPRSIFSLQEEPQQKIKHKINDKV